MTVPGTEVVVTEVLEPGAVVVVDPPAIVVVEDDDDVIMLAADWSIVYGAGAP